MAENSRSGKLAVILHADVAGSTELVRQNEHVAHEHMQSLFQRLEKIIKTYNGHVRELRGDALLAEFERVSDAVSAALAFQTAEPNQDEILNDDTRPAVRVGIAMGEVIIADDTVTGAGVVLAQRVEQLAEPGSVCITAAIHEALPERMPFDQEGLGEQKVKGFDEEIRVYRVRLNPGQAIPPPQEGDHPKASPKRLGLIAAVVAIVLITAGGTAYWFRPWAPQEEPASVERMAFPLPDKPSIAVLPFDNLGGDLEQEVFSDGLTNDIITDLSKFGHLFVIASNSSFSYKGKAVKVQQVAEDLGVRYVLEGSFQRADERLRINVQLIDATTGHHLWAERYDRDASDFFAIQEDILRTIVASLASQVTEAEIERALGKETDDLGAYDYYQRAWKLFFTFTKEGNNQALGLLEKAIELDPDYARAHGLLSWVHVNNSSGRYSWGQNPERSLELSLEAAQKAVSLDPDDYYTHWALGYAQMNHGNLDRANAGYERALALNPTDATLLTNMAELLYTTGRAEQAITQIKLAMRINPRHPDWYFWDLGLAQYIAEHYQEALDTLNRMSNPPNGVRRTRAAVLVRLGRLEEAREVMSKFIETDVDMTLEEMEDSEWEHREHLDRWIADLRTAGLPEKRPLPLPDKPSIAVLPFTNMSDDPKQEYFVDGMTEDLITDLSKLSGLFVIARNSVFTYKDKPVKVQQVARELGVRYVMEGSVRRVGNRVRINAQLIDATTDGHLWAERYDGTLDNVFALQDQVTQQIVKALEVSLTGEEEKERIRPGTDNAEAHDAFLRGWAHYKLLTLEDLAKSIPFFEEANQLDPNYAQAHAALASVYWDAFKNDWAFDINMPSMRAEAKANEHLEEALKVPTPLAYVLSARMMASFGFYDQAVSEAEQAVALDANDATAYAGLADALVFAGRPTEAIEAIQTAIRLDPHHPPDYLIILGAAQFGMENYTEAAATFERAVKRNPDNELPRIYVAASYGHLGRIDDGEAIIEATNYLRHTRGLRVLSLEKFHESEVGGEIDFKAFGKNAVQERVRSGLSRIPALTWQSLITYRPVFGEDSTWHHENTVEGATEIDIATAKALHDRGVLFVDGSNESEWNRGHIPGAVNLPRYWDETDPTKPRYQETTLSKVVDKAEEFVLVYCEPIEVSCDASTGAAKAVAWGYQKVYWSNTGVRGWREAGYPVEQAE